jgi:hypothetical protein
MSIFNNEYKSDKRLESDEKEKRRKSKYDKRVLELTMADKIYKNVVDGIDKNNKKCWTKEEMIESVRGKGRFDVAEWVTWNKYCNIAIGKVRRKYWNGDESSRRMFNYIRYRKEYWLIDFDDTLKSSVVFDEYRAKLRAAQKKDRELIDSVYRNVLELDRVKRKVLIERLMAIEKGQ